GFAKARLVLTRDSLFTGAAVLKALPDAKSYFVVIGGDLLPVARGEGGAVSVAVTPGVVVAAQDRDAFDETMAQLQRPLDGAAIRILALTP
ncbi:hypothetical protein ABTM75_19375, partial [Acinetobacter baumannii]